METLEEHAMTLEDQQHVVGIDSTDLKTNDQSKQTALVAGECGVGPLDCAGGCMDCTHNASTGSEVSPLAPTAVALGLGNARGADVLGIASPESLTEEHHRKLDLIALWPLEAITWRLRSEQSVPSHLIEQAVFEARRYFALIALADQPVGMISRYVDEAWHAFVLHSSQWETFCHVVFGHFVYHMPTLPDDVPAPIPASLRSSTEHHSNLEAEPVRGHEPPESEQSCVDKPCSTHCGFECIHRCDRCDVPGAPEQPTSLSVVDLYQKHFGVAMPDIWFAHLGPGDGAVHVESRCGTGPLDCAGGCTDCSLNFSARVAPICQPSPGDCAGSGKRP